jgi:hypothetical protein
MKYLYLLSIAFWALAGACDGLNQTLFAHYSAFEARHPKAVQSYWNPYESWVQKYADYPTDTRARFIGSKTFFVAFTDAYHMSREIEAWLIRFGWLAIAIWFLPIWTRLKYWSIPTLLVLSYIAQAIGFHALYTLYYV